MGGSGSCAAAATTSGRMDESRSRGAVADETADRAAALGGVRRRRAAGTRPRAARRARADLPRTDAGTLDRGFLLVGEFVEESLQGGDVAARRGPHHPASAMVSHIRAALARSGSRRIERASHDRPRDHRPRLSQPASVGPSVPSRGGRPPARTPAEHGTDDASELAANTHQPAPPQPYSDTPHHACLSYADRRARPTSCAATAAGPASPSFLTFQEPPGPPLSGQDGGFQLVAAST